LTVKIQNRDAPFRITARDRPENLSASGAFVSKPDMTGLAPIPLKTQSL
jgi:hypothetical protein